MADKAPGKAATGCASCHKPARAPAARRILLCRNATF